MHSSASRLSPAERERVIAVAKDINADILPNGLKSEVGIVRDIVVSCSSGNIACRVYDPPQSASLGTVLLIHGGAWIAGSIDFHDNMARLLCSISQAHVVLIEYSCAPDAMYPTQLEEIRSVIRWLNSAGPIAGLQPRPLAVCGDSAGGNMAAVIARESPANSIALVAIINPIVDFFTCPRGTGAQTTTFPNRLCSAIASSSCTRIQRRTRIYLTRLLSGVRSLPRL